MNGLDLFSGIGGITVALREWVRPIAYCEIDPFCQSVLLSRMSQGDLPRAPIWDDIMSFDGHKFWGHIDIIYGGFPCQDISIAGTGKGLAGERSGLFFEIMRLVNEIRPTFVFLENVAQLRTRGLDTIIREFAKTGYVLRWTCIRASDVGACHHRERMFLLAYSNSKRCEKRNIAAQSEEKRQSRIGMYDEYSTRNTQQEAEPCMVGVDDVIPYRMDRTRALGNSVHILQTKMAFKRLMGLK